jgi:hypothetical protein
VLVSAYGCAFQFLLDILTGITLLAALAAFWLPEQGSGSAGGGRYRRGGPAPLSVEKTPHDDFFFIQGLIFI